MRDAATASNTAALVAALRTWARLLPPPLCDLAPDPYGARLAGGGFAWVDAALARWPRLARLLARHTSLGRGTAAMALRTRCLDDAARAFHAAGGRQVVLLGAGLDARAWRLSRDADAFSTIDAVAVFEVDHPGSQRAKLAALARARMVPPPGLRFIAHDFETESHDALLVKLTDAGLDARKPTLTIWEGVTMYLSEAAVAATAEAVRGFGATGSRLALSYLHDSRRGTAAARLARLGAWATSPFAWLFWVLARRAGESPFRTSFEPEALPAWLHAHGMRLIWDKDTAAIAAELAVPPELTRRFLPATSSVFARSLKHRFALAAVAPPAAAAEEEGHARAQHAA